MKKVFIAALTAVVALTSCGGDDKNSGDSAKGNYTKEEIALGDSVSTAFGEAQGADALTQIQRMLPMMPADKQKAFSKDEFLKGVELIMTADTANVAFLFGIQQGLRMQGILMADLGVPVDAKEIVASFAKVLKSDTIDQAQLAMYQMNMQNLGQEIQALQQKKAEEEALKSPEAVENIEAGKKYADERVAEGFTRTDSGLVYKINNEGTGEKVGPNDIVSVKYVGKHIDGTEFDRSPGDAPSQMNASGVVKGFQEGLALLGKGGSATIVIPGDLGYGALGRGPIGKMETLVFEITVDDIQKPAAPVAPVQK